MKISSYLLVFLLTALVLLTGCKKNVTEPEEAAEDDILSGGAATTFVSGGSAFSQPAPNLSSENLEKHLIGDLQFEQSFIKSPSSINPGLGPLFVSNSCVNCHISDGKGLAPAEGKPVESMLFRISLNGEDMHGAPNPVPGFGTQLQPKTVLGFEAEGNVIISYTEFKGKYSDGTSYSLRRPEYIISGRVGSGILLSPRIAPPVFGLGLLEAIDDAEIISMADENDLNNDGISGKVNYVWNFEKNEIEVGRFGWKANTPALLQQTAAAYNEDIGITSPYFPMENCYSSSECDTLSDDPEISDEILKAVALYIETLAVPARRNTNNPDVKLGKKLFAEIGCTSCHIPAITTGKHPEIPELSNQKIHPYTDLLLHNMGEELSDNRHDFKANGNEWRTPPLWGIGLVKVVNGNSSFLHDGRARNLVEAILWHGGEGEISRKKFVNLDKNQRDALIKYLESL